eukprot:3576923-Pyramimonas_sp.AAC.1
MLRDHERHDSVGCPLRHLDAKREQQEAWQRRAECCHVAEQEKPQALERQGQELRPDAARETHAGKH